jgi:CBS domain-containing protein
MITSETARDIMNRELIHALEDDSLDKVVERMIQAGVKEIAILDGEKKLVGDLTMLDLLKYFHLPK